MATDTKELKDELERAKAAAAAKREEEAGPAVNHAAVQDAQAEGGIRLEAQRQLRIEAAKRKELWAALTAPFAPEDIEKLPRNLRKNDQDKGRCEDTPAGRRFSNDGHYCGGYHAWSIHLDYVGHAGITMRLNDVLGPEGWDFAPYALDPTGLPLIQRGEFWARLTIAGVTKWDLAANFGSTQEAYGDALRRCAMRFGIGTYLWSKSERALEMAKATAEEPPAPAPGEQSQAEPELTAAQFILKGILAEMDAAEQEAVRQWWKGQGLPALAHLSDEHAAQVEGFIRGMHTPDPQ